MGRKPPARLAFQLFLGSTLLVGMLLSGCRTGGLLWSSGVGTSGTEPPVLETTCAGRVFKNCLLGYEWPPAGRKVPEVPAFTPGYFTVQPGETFTFALPGLAEPPRKVEVGLYPVSTTSQDTPPTDFPPLDSRTIEASSLSRTRKAVSWSWKVPGQAAPPPNDNRDSGLRLLRVRVEWNDETYCVYGTGLQVVQPGSLDAILAALGQAPAVARGFFQAAWEGRQADVEALLVPWVVESRRAYEKGGRPSSSFEDVNETSSWDCLLWRASRVRLRGTPVFRVINVAAPEVASGAGVEATYQVLVTDASTDKQTLYDFVENYGMVLTAEGWRINVLSRKGAPHSPEPGRLTRDDGRLRCGPFTSIDLTLTASTNGWDPGGTRLAFLAGNHTREDLWVVDVSAGQGRPVLTFPTGPQTNPSFVTWSADGRFLFFMVAGRQTFGPYKDGLGLWMAKVPVGGGKPETAFFLAGPLLGTPFGTPVVTSDRSTAFICMPPDVLGVDLDRGEVVAREKDLLTLAMFPNWSFSPDGWAVMDGATRTLVDFRAGTRTRLPDPPPRQTLEFDGWTPDSLVAVEWGADEDVAESPKFHSTALAGATAISLLDTAGHEVARIEPPAPARIGSHAWAPDGSALLFALGSVEVRPVDPAASGAGSQPTFKSKEVWLWDRRSNTQTKLAGQEEDLYYIGWPAGSVVHLSYVPGTEPFERVYLSISAEGGWHVTPRQWAAGTPTRVLGEWAGSAVTALRVAKPARYRLAAERGERAETLALGDLRWGRGSVHAGYLTLEDWTSFPDSLYVVIVPLPGEPGGG